jgi:hypothetical protein
MADEQQQALINGAKGVLAGNAHVGHTIPAEGIYPHQWLWDSCFIAIGLSHYDVPRAQQELRSLIRGQWHNGMIPHMIFDSGIFYRSDRELWRSQISPLSPDELSTSGITQPPVLAEAVVRIGSKLSKSERLLWYKQMYKPLLRYHSWLYRERDPNKLGLVVNFHPWETGMDDSPPWILAIDKLQQPIWVRLIAVLKLDKLIAKLRRDNGLPTTQRESTINGLKLLSVMQKMRKQGYSSKRLLRKKRLAIEDVGFNSILIRNNHHLQSIAKTLDEPLPEKLEASFTKAETALEQLWSENGQSYYHRYFYKKELIEMESIASLLPLYSGKISKERTEVLVKKLKNDIKFSADYPVPSVAKDSGHYLPLKFWQGPAWVNTNWLIIDGLKRYGYKKEADDLTTKTIEMVNKSGFYEYFSPNSARPGGANNFSWTAALIIDVLS